MEMATYLVTAVLLEGRGVRDVARDHGISKTWLYELLARYKEHGDSGLVARSKRPHTSPQKISAYLEDEIVRVRKELVDLGFDAGAETIRHHLQKKHKRAVPSVSTIWRVLQARGFVTPEPHKRPKSSYVRFCAELPNERWQMDVTHVTLSDGREVEILNVIDDHSRLCVASDARVIFKAPDVVDSFYEAAGRYGFPASVLSDNGAIFTASARNGVCAMESELVALGIEFRHSRPYHPQTCGKVERFHQTLKKYLKAHKKPRTIAALQRQLDEFVDYYNFVRPHRAINRKTPAEAFNARTKAKPKASRAVAPPHCRVRQDKVHSGKITLRYKSRLYHVFVGRKYNKSRVLVLVADLDIRVLKTNGELIRHLTLDPERAYQGLDREIGP